jgi:regulator of replication initiation timing
MDILEKLASKLNHMSSEFQALIRENEKLRTELNELKNRNDLFTRSNQDVTLMIKNVLQKDGKI